MRPTLAVATSLAAATLLAGTGLVTLSPAAGAAAPGTPTPGTSATGASATEGGALLAEPGVHMKPQPGRTVGALPATPAMSWVVADATTGEVLAAKNAHMQLHPASTLKTLTAVTLLPKLNPKRVYTPVYDDVTPDGSKVGIVNGSHYTINQLWYGLFLASGNDTAHALARANGGIKKTVADMNAEAKILHADDTVAKTPSGLDADGQHSSAYDLALISRAGLQMPAFRKYCGTLSVKFPRAGKKAKRKTFMVYNHNPLLLRDYHGVIGVKTGYTTEDERTFVGAAKRGNRTLIVTLMDYTSDTYATAASLLTWGFKNAAKVEPVGQLVAPETATAGTGAASAADRSGGATAAGHTTSHHHSGLPLLLVVLVLVLAAAAWFAVRGARSGSGRDPLAAANKGLGRPRGSSSSRPRGRGGPGAY